MHILIKKLVINSKYYKEILSILKHKGGISRVIGGAVRDAILGKKNYDIDVITNLLPTQTIDILSKANIKVLPTGEKYGTVTAFFHEEKFEITTLRKDIKSDGRAATVVFTDNFIEDAARRDFTINALSYCPFEHKVHDYFNGIQDLQEFKVKFIGHAYQRIQEDFLRILRFFRFSCCYANQLDHDGLNACIELKENLRFLSKERIKWEMDKLIISDNSPTILQKMFDVKILPIIFPITQFDKQVFLKSISLSPEMGQLQLSQIYSLLFYHIDNLQLRNLVDLKFTKKEASKIISIINFKSQAINENILRKIWIENDDYLQYLNVCVTLGKVELITAKKFIKSYFLRSRPLFPIKAIDLQIKNIQGENIGLLLRKLQKIWIESDFLLSKNQLLEYIEK